MWSPVVLLFLFAAALPAGGPSHEPAWPPPAPAGMTQVGPGQYRPVYPVDDAAKVQTRQAFWLDIRPVTNAEFTAFVQRQPRWRRDKVARLFADTGYLEHWPKPDQSTDRHLRKSKHEVLRRPVVHVSWFAAKAYCQARGARLPTADEWDFAAAAGPTSADGRQDPAWRERILHWYSRPASGPLPQVGQTDANFWGVRDLHGVVWEWVLDFSSNLVANDDREAGDSVLLRFCGAGALSAQDKTDYASLMRIAFRSSLRAHYTSAALGFRCAADIPHEPSSGKVTRP